MLNVMVVDDERIIVEGLTQIIRWGELGLNLIGHAYDGKSALEMIVEKKPDIVITDIKMPRMDGLQMIEAVRSKGISTHFIILSGFGEFEYAKCALRLEVKDYLLKPCNEKEVEMSLKRVVEEILINKIHKEEKENKRVEEEIVEVQDEVIGNICVTQIKVCVEKYISYSELSLKWIAEKHLYMNPDYLSKQFVKVTGEKFSSYLNRIRVQKAKELLESHDTEKMVCVAEEIGLGHNPQYFSKIFKKSVGYTPTDYQKMHYMKRSRKGL